MADPRCVVTVPPGVSAERWGVLLRRCRQLDDLHNFGAGKPRLTCENDADSTPEQGFDHGTLASENESGPGAGCTAPDPASPTKES